MNYKMHCVLIIKCIEAVKMRKSVKMKMSYKMKCVLKCINNKGVPEIHFAASLKFEASVCTVSVESTLALNQGCFGARVIYVHTPGTHPPQCKAIHDSLSVLPKLEKKVKKLGVITLHMATYRPTSRASTPLTQVPYVPKSLPRALRNIRYMREWSTSSEGGGSKSL
jgi:hypothetical protein